MDRELMRLRRRIERLRNAMALAYLSHDGDLRHEEVLRISVRLDDQLNKYVRYARLRSLIERAKRPARNAAATFTCT